MVLDEIFTIRTQSTFGCLCLCLWYHFIGLILLGWYMFDIGAWLGRPIGRLAHCMVVYIFVQHENMLFLLVLILKAIFRDCVLSCDGVRLRWEQFLIWCRFSHIRFLLLKREFLLLFTWSYGASLDLRWFPRSIYFKFLIRLQVGVVVKSSDRFIRCL